MSGAGVRGCAIGFAVAVLSALAPVAHAANVRAIAAALQSDPVYVQPAAGRLLAPASAAHLGAEIASRDPGRIQFVVVTRATASRAGGINQLTNAIDQAWGQSH